MLRPANQGAEEFPPPFPVASEAAALEPGGQTNAEHVGLVVGREAEQRRVTQALGRAKVPTGAAPCVIEALEICLEDEVRTDAMRQVSFIDFTTRRRFRRENV